MTIKELAEQLQDKIYQEIEAFCDMQKTIECIEEDRKKTIGSIREAMAVIAGNLEPVESIVFQQNPHLEDIFTALKKAKE